MFRVSSATDIAGHLAENGDYSFTLVEGLSFPPAPLAGMEEATFSRCDFSSADMPAKAAGALFVDCVLSEAQFTRANLFGAQFVRCDLSRTSFSECDLSAAQFVDCIIATVRFRQCDLDAVQFSGCDVDGTALAA